MRASSGPRFWIVDLICPACPGAAVRSDASSLRTIISQISSSWVNRPFVLHAHGTLSRPMFGAGAAPGVSVWAWANEHRWVLNLPIVGAFSPGVLVAGGDSRQEAGDALGGYLVDLTIPTP